MTAYRQIGLLIIGAAVAGCGNFRETVGLEVPPPDEFLVVSRAPLEAPPDPTALPTPRLGAPSRVEPDPVRNAQAALSGAGSPVTAAPSPGEQALVARAGPADPAIRSTLASDDVPTERRFGLDSFFGVEIEQDPSAAARRLDPTTEAERLRDAGAPAPVVPPAN